MESYIKKGLFWILLFCCSFYCVTNSIFPISPVYKIDEIYVQLKASLGKGNNQYLAISENKKLNIY